MSHIGKKRIRIPFWLRVAVNTVEVVVFICLLAICFIMLSPLLPTRNFIQAFIVQTGSMEPSIATGAVAVVTGVTEKDLSKGDVIAFTDPDRPPRVIIHRIHEVKKSGSVVSFVTKGDKNKRPDGPTVSPSGIKGKMIATIPYLGYLGRYVKTPAGFIVFVALPAILLVLLQIRKIKEGIEEEVIRRTKAVLEHPGRHHTEHIVTIFFMIGALSVYAGGYSARADAAFSASGQVIGLSFAAAQLQSDEPGLQLFRHEDNLSFKLTGIGGCSSFDYTLTYQSDSGQQGVQGTVQCNGIEEYESSDFFMGTCSGVVCVPHTNLSNFEATVILHTIGSDDQTLTDGID